MNVILVDECTVFIFFIYIVLIGLLNNSYWCVGVVFIDMLWNVIVRILFVYLWDIGLNWLYN